MQQPDHDLPERIETRIEEYTSLLSPGAPWVRGPLREILHLHPTRRGRCTTCVASKPTSAVCPMAEPYPCPTVRTVMGTIHFDQWAHAHTAVAALVDHASERGGPRPVATLRRPEADQLEVNRFAFEIVYSAQLRHMVLMPGRPLDHLRPGADGRVAELDRIYVDGGSWAWPFAARMLAEGAGENA